MRRGEEGEEGRGDGGREEMKIEWERGEGRRGGG